MIVDDDQYATDLGKCIKSVVDVENKEQETVSMHRLATDIQLR